LLIITGVGLAAAAGLNAYIPLLIVGLLARFDVISLQSPYSILESTPALIILGVLLAIEVVADKVPAVDTINDTVQTLVRPASGAVLFAGALAPDSDWSQALGLIAGLATAGSVHAAKSVVRPVANVGTGGVAAPVLSTGEDIMSVVLSLSALLLPLLALALLLGFAVMAWLAWRRLRRRRRDGVPNSVS
jgi:hypothetical protein